MSVSQIICRLQDVELARDNGFSLKIPDFSIPKPSDGGINKIPFMGVSGAGKSTLLNIMAGIEWPGKGTVTWIFPEHAPISWSTRGPEPDAMRELRRRFFGYAFQDSTLMEHLRIGDNLIYPLLLKGETPAKARKTAREALWKVLIGDEKSKINDYLNRFPFQLSGGQRQRIALVQAMIHDPFVLFADEPTGSLDADTREQVMGVLYEWVDDREHRGKRLLIWVTHHEDDPAHAGVRQFLQIISGQLPDWKPTPIIDANADFYQI